MNTGFVAGAVLIMGLMVFYWWNDPRARDQDEERRQHRDRTAARCGK
jgi:hypothetical protein